MSTIHSSGKHYREEFEPQSSRAWRRARLLIALLLASTFTHYLAFLGGAYLNAQECRAVATAASTRPSCSAIANGLTQWNCSENEFRDHYNTCAARGTLPAWTRFIKPKSPPKE